MGRRRNATAAAGAALAGLLASMSLAAERSAVRVAPLASPPASRIESRPLERDWPKYCADAAMTGQAHHETAISPSSMLSIHAAWQATLPGPIASSPTVVAGKVCVGD